MCVCVCVYIIQAGVVQVDVGGYGRGVGGVRSRGSSAREVHDNLALEELCEGCAED